MNLFGFLLRASWMTVAIAALTGSLSGAWSVLLIASVNNAVSSNNHSSNQLWSFIGLALVTLLTSILSRFLLVSLSQAAVYKLRLRLSGWILSCPLRHLEELAANRLLATLTEDVQSIAFAVFNIHSLCINMALVIGCLAYLGWLSWAVFLVTLTFLMVVIATIQFLVTKVERLF